jgi:hypothetical protein
MYHVCGVIDIHRTDGALPMSCIQMYYVCGVFDIHRTDGPLPMSHIQMYSMCHHRHTQDRTKCVSLLRLST